MHQYQYWLSNKDFRSSFLSHRLTSLWFALMRKTCRGWLFWQLLWCATWYPLAAAAAATYKAHTHSRFSHQIAPATHLHFSVYKIHAQWCILNYLWCNLIYFISQPFLFYSIFHAFTRFYVNVNDMHVLMLMHGMHYLQQQDQKWISVPLTSLNIPGLLIGLMQCGFVRFGPFFLSVHISVFFSCYSFYSSVT